MEILVGSMNNDSYNMQKYCVGTYN